MGVYDIDSRRSLGEEDVVEIQIKVVAEDKMDKTQRKLELVNSEQRNRPLLYLFEDSSELTYSLSLSSF